MPEAPLPARYRGKTLAAWLALVFGALGLHRLYLHGAADRLAWAHPPLTLLGVVGVERLATLGPDDRLAWVLVPLLGLMLTQGMLFAILYALTPDERWDTVHNPGQPGAETRWGAVLAAVAGLLLGGIVLIGTIAFSIEKAFEWQLDPAADEPPRR